MKGVLFDVDGTLVDSNYLHVLAWWASFPAGRRSTSRWLPSTAVSGWAGAGSSRNCSTTAATGPG